MNKTAISLVIEEDEFKLDSLSMGALLGVMDFNDRYENGEINLATKDGLIEFLDFLVLIFEDEKLDREKLMKANVTDLLESISLRKINDWIEDVMPREDGQSENDSESAGKKKQPQPVKPKSRY